MKPNEIRSQLVIFVIFAGIVSLILVLLPFIEPALTGSVTTFFGSNDPKMGEMASELFVSLLKIFKIILWMSLVVAIVRFVNSIISKTLLRNSGNAELAILVRNILSILFTFSRL